MNLTKRQKILLLYSSRLDYNTFFVEHDSIRGVKLYDFTEDPDDFLMTLFCDAYAGVFIDDPDTLYVRDGKGLFKEGDISPDEYLLENTYRPGVIPIFKNARTEYYNWALKDINDAEQRYSKEPNAEEDLKRLAKFRRSTKIDQMFGWLWGI